MDADFTFLLFVIVDGRLRINVSRESVDHVTQDAENS